MQIRRVPGGYPLLALQQMRLLGTAHLTLPELVVQGHYHPSPAGTGHEEIPVSGSSMRAGRGHSSLFLSLDYEKQPRSTYMFTPEVKAAIGGEQFMLDKLIRDGILHPVAGRRQQVGTYGLFLREEVEQISCEERLRISQVANMLQISIAAVRRLLQRGS